MKRKELRFFQGGIHPNDRKGRTRLKSVNVAPLLEKCHSLKNTRSF